MNAPSEPVITMDHTTIAQMTAFVTSTSTYDVVEVVTV
jgi:hypothetical protein